MNRNVRYIKIGKGIDELRPSHFPNGKSFDTGVFAKLKKALKDQRRQMWLMPVVTLSIMFVGWMVFAEGIGGIAGYSLAAVCCGLAPVVGVSLTIGRTRKKIATTCKTLGIKTTELHTALQKVR
jgi:hypothetical protein